MTDAREAKGRELSRIPDLQSTEDNEAYWKSSAWAEQGRDDAVLAMEQAANAWKNAAYAMADQRNAALTPPPERDAVLDGPVPPMLSIVPHLRSRPDHVGVEDMVVLAKDYFALSSWTKMFIQAVLDPENQPSQFGTQLSSAQEQP